MLHSAQMLFGFSSGEFAALHIFPEPLDDESKDRIKPYDLGFKDYTINTKQQPLSCVVVVEKLTYKLRDTGEEEHKQIAINT